MFKLNRKQIEEISEKTKMSYKDTMIQILEQLEADETKATGQYIRLFQMLSKVEPRMIRQIKALLYGYFEKRGMLGEFEDEY